MISEEKEEETYSLAIEPKLYVPPWDVSRILLWLLRLEPGQTVTAQDAKEKGITSRGRYFHRVARAWRGVRQLDQRIRGGKKRIRYLILRTDEIRTK